MQQKPASITTADLESELSRNGAAIAAARALAAVTSLVALPVVIHYLGLNRFGLWEAILALASLTTLITDAASGTLLWQMSLAWGEGDDRTLRRLVRIGLTGSLVLPLLLVPVALLFQSSVTTLFGVAAADATTVGSVFVTLVALVAFSGINGTLGALNSARQQVRVTALAQTAGQITMYAVSIGGLRAGFGLVAMVMGTAAGHVSTAGILALGARRRRGFERPKGSERRGTRMTALRYFGVLSVGGGAAFLRGQTDRLILASLVSPVWAGYYGVAARLSSLLREVSNLLYVPSIAASGALVGANDWGGVRRLYGSAMATVSLVGAAVGLVLIGLSGPIVLLWVGTPVAEASTILRILAAGTLIAVVITGPGTAICKGIGRPDIELRYVVVSLLVNAVLTVGLVMAIGPIGTVLASSASWAIGALYFAWMVHTVLRLPRVPTRRAGATLVGTGVAAALIAVAIGVMPALVSRRDALLAIVGFAPVGVAALLAVSGRLGGLGYGDAARLLLEAQKIMKTRAPRGSEP